MLKNWIKIFIYQVKNNKFFTALNILGLSLGIAGLVFAILYWNDEHNYNAWNPEKEKVYQILNEVGADMLWATNVAPLRHYIKDVPEIEEFCYLNNWYFDEFIAYGEKKGQFKILDTQKNFFSFFPFEFISGSINNALPDDASIVLSEEAAKKLFGNETALGKQVQYSGRNLVVRGVYRIPGKSSYAPMAVTSLTIESGLKENDDQWGNFSYGLLLKLKDPSKAEVVKKKVEDIYLDKRSREYAKNEGLSLEDFIKKNGRSKVMLEQLADARLHSAVEGYPEGRGNYQFLLIMVGLSVLILMLSIVNYVNLATANAIKRAKEVGVRKILGAGKGNIVRQFIFETFITTTAAMILALVIVELSLPYYNEFLSKALVISSSQFYWQLALIFVFVIIVAGMFPAIYVANFKTLNVLKGNFGRSKSGVWLRNIMLILQFGIAAFFIIGSYIVYQQVNYMSTKDLGLKGDQVIDIFYRGPRPQPEDPTQIYAYYETIKNELRKIKGVQGVSAGAFSFGNSANSSSSFTYKDKSIQGQNMAIDFEMLDMMQIKMVQGRGLSPNFSSDTINGMLINETAMKMMGEKDPVGKEVDWNDEKLKVIGVVKDFHLYGPQDKIPPMAFFHFKTIDWMSYNLNRIYIKIAPGDMETTIAEIEKFWNSKVDIQYPIAYDFVDKNYARTYQTYVKQRNLFSLLNGVVILIALFGLFALASYSIQRRMKEIAIRKTLGAETKMLLKELSKQYVVFCIIGFIIAFVPAWLLLDKWLDNFAFRIDISVTPFIVGFVVLMVLTLAVVLSRAYMATMVNVLKYLKYE
jgi:putative ABC transport system permease protein